MERTYRHQLSFAMKEIKECGYNAQSAMIRRGAA